jgi:hypothetical protein
MQKQQEETPVQFVVADLHHVIASCADIARIAANVMGTITNAPIMLLVAAEMIRRMTWWTVKHHDGMTPEIIAGIRTDLDRIFTELDRLEAVPGNVMSKGGDA